MRLVMAILLAAAALPLVAAPASAHACNSWDCGPCVQGEYHEHNDMHGQCASSPRGYAENGWRGQRASPGTATLGTLLALTGAAAGLALVRGRRA